MTEEEAKTKWCPFMVERNHSHDPGTYISATFILGRGCIASACMAWRWEGWSEVEREPRGDAYRIRYEQSIGRTGSGFCGLAGTPP